MSFTCTICSLDIQVGETLLADERMNLAHKACVDRLMRDPAHPAISIPSVRLSPPPPAPPPPAIAAPDSCVPTSPVRFCSECGKPCISMCPAPCLQYVHQDFGYSGPNCSGRHEARCEVARMSREPDPKPSPKTDLFEVIRVPHQDGNGTHVIPVAKKKRTRR